MIRGYGSDDKLLRTIRQYEAALGRRLTVEGCDLYIAASFGYTVFPDDADNSDSLISYANA